MGLAQRLAEDLQRALKNRDEVRVSTLRLARAAVHNAEIERGRALSDPEIQEVLRREVKRRREAIEAYRRAGREEAARREELEMAVLIEYLPQPLSEQELRALVQQGVRETGAAGPRDAGRVVGWVMARAQGRADGRRVAELVQEVLRG
ncbi:MAG: aspartyl-tRNA amidotransferase [candidate division GAL15 bacterium]